MKTNLKICLVLSLLGVILLIFLSSHLTPREYTIINITRELIGNYVMIKGNIFYIKNIKESEFYILTISDSTGKITGTLNSKDLSINKSQNYIFSGKIEKYENETQININKIIVYDN
jgi:uncharacterized protein YdeI (BOF family)